MLGAHNFLLRATHGTATLEWHGASGYDRARTLPEGSVRTMTFSLHRKAAYYLVRWQNRIAAILLVTCWSLLIGCGGAHDSGDNTELGTKILGGESIDPLSAPAVVEVALYYINGERGLCTGTVVGGFSVITAGHCFQPGLVAAEIVTSSGILTAQSVLLHPGYFEDQQLGVIFNDIAIVHTGMPINLPAVGIGNASNLPLGSPTQIYGVGTDDQGQIGYLQTAQIVMDTVTANHLVSVPYLDGASNPCLGDSGGPAIVDGRIVGLVSTGTVVDCAPGDVTFFTNLEEPGIRSFLSTGIPDLILP